MNFTYILLPLIYFSISFSCFYLGWRGYTRKQIIFNKGIKGTSLENSALLMWAQVYGILFLGIVLFGYGLFALNM